MRAPVVALAVWTFVVWVGRIRNAIVDDAGAGPVMLAGTFVVLAAAAAVSRGSRPAVLALAGWTVAVWVVRAFDIAVLSDHDAAFVAVHVVLAAVSIALAVWAWRAAYS